MPVLPSGLKVAIYKDHILPPDKNWFKAPENHFWYWTPAPENPPPFKPSDVWEATPVTAPIPRTREEMKQYIRVVISLPDGKMYWEGDFMTDFPFFRELSDEDIAAWKTWTEREDVGDFLDHGISQCVEQYIANQQAQGFVVSTVRDGEVDYAEKEIVPPDAGFKRQ